LQDDIFVSSRCNPEDRDITYHVGKVKVNPLLPETILLQRRGASGVAAMPIMTLPPTMNFRSGKEAVQGSVLLGGYTLLALGQRCPSRLSAAGKNEIVF